MTIHHTKYLAWLMLGVLTACQSLPTTPHLSKSLTLSQMANTLPTPHSATPQPHNNKITPSPFDALIDYSKPAQTSTSGTDGALSGYYPLATGADAFAARSLFSRMARHKIDVQYYIWHDDTAGQLMLKDLWEAAERGVIVRLLLDDFNSSAKLDALLLKFASHPNIAVRLVNPATHRKFRPINFVVSPARINRRMHNKSMTFDNKISIIGGRNIGDEYLNNHPKNHFVDLDVILAGQVVSPIHQSFETYWQSPAAFDIETLAQPNTKTLQQMDKAFLKTIAHDDAKHAAYVATLDNPSNTPPFLHRPSTQPSPLLTLIHEARLPMRWVKIDFVADNVKKLTGRIRGDELLVTQLQGALGTPSNTLSIVSSYFVPTKTGVDALIALQNSGVLVQILTNSYRATDVGSVHSGYEHRRKALLKAGVRLFELKHTAPQRDNHSTTTSLHAKAFAVDTNKVFIGSYNIDPRSANINSELGVVIYDDMLANQLHSAFGQSMLTYSYEVKLNNNKLEWHTLENGKLVIYHSEPSLLPHQHLSIKLLSFLPIEGFL